MNLDDFQPIRYRENRSRNIYGRLNEFLFVHRFPMQIPRRSKLKAARNGELYLLCRAYFRAHGIFINLLLLSPLGRADFFARGTLLRSIPVAKYDRIFQKFSTENCRSEEGRYYSR